MIISEKSWSAYLDRLRRVNDKAAGLISQYIQQHDITTKDGHTALLEYVEAVVGKYSEGAAEAACQMYDAVAEASGKVVPAAEPALTPTFGDVAKTLNGTMKHVTDPDGIGASCARLVKRTGVDTTMKNAIRDGAEWAWVPHGDTCGFCLMLASNGWQRASKKTLKGGHAEHIHANCDCTYAIRFDGKSNVAGYDPDALYEQYMAAGENRDERLRNMQQGYRSKRLYESDKKKVFAENTLIKPLTNDTISITRYVNTNGHRNEVPLSKDEKRKAEEAARRQGFKGSIGYSDNAFTAITGFPNEDGSRSAESSLLIIGTDAYPVANGKTANDKLSLDCCMAHEIVGHHEAWLKHTDQEDPILEEVQASIRASRFGVGLTDNERSLLYQDAMDRLAKAGIEFEDIKDNLDILER